MKTALSRLSYGVKIMVDGEPGAIRTPDPQIRSLMLYPAELRVHRGAAFSCAGMALQGQFGIICANNLWLGRVDRAWR